MTKRSILEREKKRINLSKKYYLRRIKFKKIISSSKHSDKEKWNAFLKLQKLPRDSSKSRVRNRCLQTGRPRAFLRNFGLSRIKFRELAVNGEIPGIKKSSW
ncbi:MAG: 30S ribosomal protein S14 [Enterobacteriaceae bacterium]